MLLSSGEIRSTCNKGLIGKHVFYSGFPLMEMLVSYGKSILLIQTKLTVISLWPEFCFCMRMKTNYSLTMLQFPLPKACLIFCIISLIHYRLRRGNNNHKNTFYVSTWQIGVPYPDSIIECTSHHPGPFCTMAYMDIRDGQAVVTPTMPGLVLLTIQYSTKHNYLGYRNFKYIHILCQLIP